MTSVKRWGAILLAAVGLCTAARAVVPRFESIGDPGAVRDNVVSALALDARGLLWAGSPEGLLRFDGYAFRRYPLAGPDGRLLPEQFVRAMLPDPRGWMWVAAGNSGLVRMDMASGRWDRWARDGKSADETAPAANTVRSLALEKNGTLWIGGSGGLDRFDVKTQRFTHHRGRDDGLPDPRVQTLLVDRQGTLWIGTWRGLARKAPDGPIETLDVGVGDQLVTLISEALDGRVIVGTAQGRLRALSPQGQPLPFSPGAQPGATAGAWPVMAMAQPDADELWFGDASGLSRRRATDGALIERLTAAGAANAGSAPRSDVRALIRDPAGTVWAGSYGGGLMRHVPSLPGLSMVRDGLGGPSGGLDVRSILQLDNGEIWLGTLAGGIERRDRQLQPLGLVAQGPGGLPPGRVNALGQTRDGSVWVAIDTQLLRFDAQGHWKETLRSGNAVPRRLHAGADGALWIATLDGVMRWTPARPVMRPVPTAGLVGGTGEVNAFAALPDGSLWAGGAAGLFRIARPGADEPVAEWVEPQGLTGQTVLGMAVDLAGRLWVDTGTGLHRLVESDGRRARFEAIGASDIGGAFGANLLFDKQGRIWSQRNMYDPRSGERRELGAADGADLGTGWFRAYAKLDDGRMLFGGARGLLVIDPERFAPWTYQPPLVVSELRVDGEERVLPEGGALVLAPGERGFSLAFAALDYSQPGRNRYRYRLEGLDAGWIDAGALGRSAAYTNLAPGSYALRVQGSNRDGAWSSSELKVGIDVHAAWWQTRWALAGAIVAGALLVAGIVNMRTRLLLRHRRVLEVRVQERTVALEAAKSALTAKSAELEEASLTDPLTGLRNRRFLDRQMPADVALALRHYEPPAVAGQDCEQDLLFFLIDIDHFKGINDAHGHMAGDAVLMQMRGRLEQVFRATDYLVRWGGEEFLIVARGTPRRRAAELAERARLAVSVQPFELAGGLRAALTCSVGFSAFPLCAALPRALDWRAAIDLADAALYEAKGNGRDAWVGLLDARADGEDALRQDLRRPLDAWAGSGRLTLLRSSRPTQELHTMEPA
ncbi:ligand-binding sensor domain-containing diguanylate cyclase [Roseateles sp.]|uniref:ligand-binding sensor domain-containing diguanylate cyclase n=1 Tax=Roseateles sp. TaxID=1971397 RepID=UPI0025CD8A12|nr:ligand-binding sensor domain-containing diguanylate cyclase [Roseateles sp.]MBV8034192.1 diguanylate cyclase [Roseateles sp.]